MPTDWDKPSNRVLNDRIMLLSDRVWDLLERVKKLEDENKKLYNIIDDFKENKRRKTKKRRMEE